METIVYVLQVVQMTSKVILSVTKNVMWRHAIGMITLVLSVPMAVGRGCYRTMSVKMNVKIENAPGITTRVILQLKIIQITCMLWEFITSMVGQEQELRTTLIEV